MSEWHVAELPVPTPADPWHQGPFLGFDTETTGVRVREDRIVTAALVRRTGTGPAAATTVTTWLADPGIEIPAGAAAIHGVTTEIARRDGRPAPDVVDEIAAHLTEAQLAGIPVVAFNAAYDLTILDAELARYGLPTLPQRLGRPVSPVLDPLVLDRGVDRYRRGKRTLTDLCAHYGVATDDQLHRADADVVATLDVLAALVSRYAELQRQSLDELHAWQVAKHRAWAQNFNSWLAGQGRVADVSEHWPCDPAR